LCRSSSRERKQRSPSEGSEIHGPAAAAATPETAREGELRRMPTPHPGEGDRHLDCAFYEACLDLAVLEDWESFHCEGCGFRKTDEGGYSSGRTPLQ
ncbi:MAG: hypothetical protein JXL84_04015, partial [Deltaproteobacteria bacterium]|nr:hypothetical protein [Deltaproteobacteria bacterium]